MQTPKYLKFFWLIPLVLLGLFAHQAFIAWSVQNTMSNGEAAVATVKNLQIRDMVAQSHGLVELEIPLKNGQAYQKKMTVPAAWVYALGKKSLNTMAVHVLPGAGEDVILDEIARIQFRTTLINLGVIAVFFFMVVFGLVSWSRYLQKNGDPADRIVEDAEPIYEKGWAS